MFNKKILLAATTVFSVLALSVSFVAGAKHASVFRVKGVDDYTITLNASKLTGETSTENGYQTDYGDVADVVAKTDQNENDVHFAYQQSRYRYFNNAYFEMKGDGEAALWNTTAIRSMVSMRFNLFNSVIVEWGWKESSTIEYVDSQEFSASNYEVTCDFADSYPSYFRIKTCGGSGLADISSIVITLKKECTESESPYVISNGIRYQKRVDHYAVLGLSGSASTNVTLETSIGGIPVTEIGEKAFYNNKTLESINLNNITKVEDNAFYYCDHLSNVGSLANVTYFGQNSFYYTRALSIPMTFNAGVTKIDYQAFCFSNLTSIVIPDGANPDVGYAAFRNINNLTSVDIGDSATDLDDFMYCENLETITVDENNIQYKAVDNVLYESYGVDHFILVRLAQKRAQTTYTMPADVVSMNSYSGFGCTTLQELTLNDAITYIPDDSFNGCTALHTVTFGAGDIDRIGNYAFGNCNALTDLVIPGTVKKIYGRAFNTCMNLGKVIIEEGTTRLCGDAFWGCTSLKIVVLPTTLTDVGVEGGYSSGDVFTGCTALTKVFTRLTSGSYANEETGWLGGRTLLYYSSVENNDGAHWHEVGANNAARVWSTTLKIQSNDEYSGSGAWFAVWAWTEGSDNGAFYYDSNAPVDYLYTITVPTTVNSFIILRMKGGVDAGSISSFPDGQFYNRSGDWRDVAFDEVTISGWHDPVVSSYLALNWQ